MPTQRFIMVFVLAVMDGLVRPNHAHNEIQVAKPVMAHQIHSVHHVMPPIFLKMGLANVSTRIG